MMYLDGSRFFFDIESCFSDRVAAAKSESANVVADTAATEICKGFGAFFGIKPEFVRAAKDYSVLLNGILPKNALVTVPEFDVAGDILNSALPGLAILPSKKSPDMKIRAIQQNPDANAIFLTNPCCPTGLELTKEEIKKLAMSTDSVLIVDESCMVTEDNSATALVEQLPNIVVLKKMRFGGEPVFACGQNLPKFDSMISAENQAVSSVIFSHTSALKTAQRKLCDSRDSLYIRIKKLAVKYDSVERLYRTKASCVFFKVKDAKRKCAMLSEHGIAVLCYNGHLCIFAGSKEENEAVLAALEEIL